MVFCNYETVNLGSICQLVTILILIDGFLQYGQKMILNSSKQCHNPYFNRWFSAIQAGFICVTSDNGHNPYFNRWFSAI